ncbi:MAG: zinc-dependent metalloprotease [Tepidisphaerales bacterium]
MRRNGGLKRAWAVSVLSVAVGLSAGLGGGGLGGGMWAWGQESGGQRTQGLPPLAEVVKDMEVITAQGGSPLMTFYRHNPGDPSKDHTRLLALIPRSAINVDLMMANSISRGSNFGFPLDDGVLVKWEQSGNRLLLLAPDTRLKAEGNHVINAAVQATYRPTILAGFPILATDNQGGILIDLSPMLYSGMSGIPVVPQLVRRDLSRVTKVKSFPENVLVDVDIAIGQPGSNTVSTIGVSYAFRRLPPLGSYTPRVADERVGYFTTVRQDWTTRYTERENLQRLINRWNLRKQDPSLELSPPERPITFIIEKTVPIQFRKYVAEGILEWNKAFEAIGITGAIVVQQQTDDNEFKDVDPEDARYNFIRWIVTGQGFAMGPSRPDPRTGQLLDADIIFDDAMVRFYAQDLDIFGPKSMAADLGPSIIEFYRDNPAFLPAGVELPREDRELLRAAGEELLRDAAGVEPATSDAALLRWSRRARESRECSVGTGLRHQVNMLQIAAALTGNRTLPERLIGQIVKDITSHEVGHTLGLRHNFKASTWLSVDEIRKARDAGQATWASTMDYNPLLYFPGDKVDELKFITSPTIGPYDYWAIEYGYSAPPRGKSEAEHLAAVASRNTQPGLAYATDEDVVGLVSPDPAANRFDMGNDPVAWAKMRIEVADNLLKDLREWAVKKDEPNHVLRSIYTTLMFERVRFIPFAARQVSGLYQSRARLGDPDAPTPFTLVDPKLQREALKFINETVFTEEFFTKDAEILNLLGSPRWSDWASRPAARTDFPVHAAVLSYQNATLTALTSPPVLQRVYDAERRSTADDKFTVAELIRSVRDGLWSDLSRANGRFTDARPMIPSFRRNLQQQYLQNMLAIAEIRPTSSVSPDVQNMVRLAMRELSERIGKALENRDRLDFGTRAHLAEAKTRIDRVLDAPYVPAAGGGGATILMLGQPTPPAPSPAAPEMPDAGF